MDEDTPDEVFRYEHFAHFVIIGASLVLNWACSSGQRNVRTQHIASILTALIFSLVILMNFVINVFYKYTIFKVLVHILRKEF